MVYENEKYCNKLKIFLTATPIFNAESDYDNITSLLTHKNQTFATTTTLQGEANSYDFQLKINMQPVAMNDKEEAITDYIYENDCGSLTGFLKRISASSFHSLMEFVNNRTDFCQSEEYELLDYNDKTDLAHLKEFCNKWSEDSKLKKLLELIEKLSGKVVIFSCFLNTCDYLEQKLKEKYQIYKVTGKTTAKDINKNISDFKNKTGKVILICSDAVSVLPKSDSL